MFAKKVSLVLTFTLCLSVIQAAPQLLRQNPVGSPDNKFRANVEWDDAGFIGRIRMLIYESGSTPIASIELPQIKPAPGNLVWISERWVACESFVAESGAAFLYADVAKNKGYLLEILAADTEPDWIISYTTNDSQSSEPIHALTEGKTSLFPLLLRDFPENGDTYLTLDFALLLSDAVDSYTQWRKKEGFEEMKFLSEISTNNELGSLVIASLDDSAEVIYFPQGTTSTREMLTLTRHQKLPQSVQDVINGIDPPTLEISWLDGTGKFSITGTNDDNHTTELVQGRFEGVKDSPYTGPGLADLLKDLPGSKDTDDKPESSSKSKSKSSTKISVSKKPASKATSSKKKANSKSGKTPSRSN